MQCKREEKEDEFVTKITIALIISQREKEAAILSSQRCLHRLSLHKHVYDEMSLAKNHTWAKHQYGLKLGLSLIELSII